MDETLQDVPWKLAGTLNERLEALRGREAFLQGSGCNREASAHRLTNWQSQLHFASGLFEQRLAADDIREDQLIALLGTAGYLFSPGGQPQWLTQLLDAYGDETSPEQRMPVTDHNCTIPSELLELVAPLLRSAQTRLHAEFKRLCAQYPEVSIDTGAIEEDLSRSLAIRLLQVISRTLVLELRIAGLEDQLPGANPEERFESFIRRIADRRHAMAVWRDYPVLARQCVTIVNQWLSASQEFVQRLCSDWKALEATFWSEQDPGVLAHVHLGAGDPHRGGRSVTILRFESGLRLMYKPRCLSVDEHFQELLQWLNERADHPPFRTLQILNRTTHGWVEFVCPHSCASELEVQRFFERQGAYLALFYALEGADLHFENVIAAGEHPMFVDVELLFQPRLPEVDGGAFEDFIDDALTHSVWRSGLLPSLIFDEDDASSIDLSGLAIVEGQRSPVASPSWQNPGTDQMHLGRQRTAMKRGQNRPLLQGNDVELRSYSETIMTGFRKLYDCLLQNRESLVSSEGPLSRFAKDEVRVVLRPTMTYQNLLFESCHPDVLQNAVDRDLLLEVLWSGFERAKWIRNVVASEKADLLSGDIPVFTTDPSSDDLRDSAGRSLGKCFDATGMAVVQERCARLSSRDMQLQLILIQASLGAGYYDAEARVRNKEKRTPETDFSSRLREAATVVGNRLSKSLIWASHGPTWLGMSPLGDSKWALSPIGCDLYAGLAGIALFLGQLGRATGKREYSDLGRAAVNTIREQVRKRWGTLQSVGGYSGFGGLIYAFSHLGVLWDDSTLISEAEAMSRQTRSLIPNNVRTDVLDGLAGLLLSLLSLYEATGKSEVLAAATECGERIIASAEPIGRGVAWPASKASPALTGFAHGAAGIACALLKLSAVNAQQRFRECALQGIEYERSLFSAEHGNWPDLRNHNAGVAQGAQSFMVAWCHGAPGIALARMACLDMLKDCDVRKEIEAGLRTTIKNGTAGNHSLCHGALGNLDCLLTASHVLDNETYREPLEQLTRAVLHSIDESGIICGTPLGMETPGLMAGLAGIGYQLLRIADPAGVPSVLTLQPPHTAFPAKGMSLGQDQSARL